MGAVKKSTLKRRERAKRTARITFVSVLILIILAVGSVFYLRSRHIASIELKIAHQLTRKDELVKENEELRELLGKRNDLEYIEYLARKKLGLIKPGEEKYIIVDP